MSLRDDVIDMKKELEDVREQSLAMELLRDQRRQNKRLFIIWIITFVAFICLLGYTLYLLNDISVITTDEYTQEITEIETIENSTITNGGGN